MDDASIDPALSSPISNLSGDILWNIFLENADMFNPLECDIYLDGFSMDLELEYNFSKRKARSAQSALLTTLRCTHVCQSWRAVILGSSVIWAQIIRVDRLYLFSREGREEVLRRTGSAPLYVMGEVPDSQDFVAAFLVPFLQADLGRVRKLHLRVYNTSHLSGSFWNALVLNAPLLEHLAVTYSGLFVGGLYLEDKSQSKLAGKHGMSNTPVLQLLHMQRLEFRLDNLNSKQLNQIQSFKLYSSSTYAKEVLNALAHMPLLKDLNLGDVQGGIDSERQSLHLPRLIDLTFSLPIRTCIEFAQKIEPAKHCNLRLIPNEMCSHQDFMEAIPLISRYIRNLLALPAPLAVLIRASLERFCFMVPRSDDLLSLGPMVDIDFIRRSDNRHIDNLRLLDPHLGYDLCAVNDLTLEISGEAHPSAASFINSLTEVESLRINAGDLKILLSSYITNTSLFFPRLQTLRLLETTTPHLFNPIFDKFVSHRESMKCTLIKALDIGGDPHGDWSFLEDRAAGVEVTWRKNGSDYVYTCGSGSSTQLQFDPDPGNHLIDSGEDSYDSLSDVTDSE